VPQAEALRAEGASVMYLAVDGQLAGLLAVSDPVKASTPRPWRPSRHAGLRVVMATGDGLTTAKAVAAAPGHRRGAWRGQAGRQAHVGRALQKEGRIVAMAGDGINDAPAWRRPMWASPWEREPTWR
jgi:Cu+-exporting ATPase